MKLGLNMYSLNKLIKTDEWYLETLKKLKEMGYSFIQFSGREFNADLIKRGVEETGLPVCLTHSPYDRILNDSDKLMEDHAKFNCKNIGLGVLDYSLYFDEKLFKDTMKKLNDVAEKFAKNGFKFFVHNHNNEFTKLSNGQTLYDYMIENCPYFNFTVDTYWLQLGGVNVLEYLDKIKGRIECVHLKDLMVVYNPNTYMFDPKIAPLGDGNLNFSDIIAKCKEGGTEYFLVEQDNACTFEDPLGQVERSIKYINKNF
jgi:sugar phosphate isomerase/epimerase